MDDMEWPYASGDIAAMIRTRDWGGTPLGPVAGWPERLCGLVDTLLENPVPTALLWGPDGILLYNDGYAVVCGQRHPAVLGGPLRDAWPEAWEFNGRMLANCMAGNHETHQNVSFLLERDGGPRESWFEPYYGPVRGAGGAVAGVLATVIEITDQVEAERGARSNARARSGRRPASSTSACRTWTATCWRSACAPSRPPPAHCSWPRRAMARPATAGARWPPASTTTSSSRSICKSCTRSSTRPVRGQTPVVKNFFETLSIAGCPVRRRHVASTFIQHSGAS